MMRNSNYELRHHGILGQKWGVRNGPPYPLSSSKKQKIRSSNGNIAKRSSNEISNKAKGKRLVDSFMAVNGNKSAGEAEEELVAYLAMAAVYLATFGILRYSAKKKEKKERADFIDELNQRRGNSAFSSLKDVPKLENAEPPSDNMKVTNPDFPAQGTTVNCTFCTSAMAMREKGYNVKAAKCDHAWYSDDLFSKCFNSPTVKMDKKQNAKQMLDTLSSLGDGAYGNLSVSWKLGGGHSIFFKNENGKTRIYDGQNGQEYDVTYPKTSAFMNAINLKNVQYNRLDNCNPTEYVLGVIDKV